MVSASISNCPSVLELTNNPVSLNCSFPAPAIKASVASNVKLASPAIASDPVTVTNVLSVEPVRATELDPAPMSDKTCVPVL